jgi:hypothetical protein
MSGRLQVAFCERCREQLTPARIASGDSVCLYCGLGDVPDRERDILGAWYNHSRRKVQTERVTGEALGEGIKDGATLLAPGGAERADATEGIRAGIATERT